ncbi:hypothetical protein Aco03nite_055210 [Actinoplanes couchii]|uniref:Uncharacterized protein n=1 Tax=Actinoplanes couchii TaxID=403638 RepID=A0ABQ3XF31_9ACTN|nr:hypothetical protein Aco03nite_055210 [Actinoplanes couchii]
MFAERGRGLPDQLGGPQDVLGRHLGGGRVLDQEAQCLAQLADRRAPPWQPSVLGFTHSNRFLYTGVSDLVNLITLL